MHASSLALGLMAALLLLLPALLPVQAVAPAATTTTTPIVPLQPPGQPIAATLSTFGNRLAQPFAANATELPPLDEQHPNNIKIRFYGHLIGRSNDSSLEQRTELQRGSHTAGNYFVQLPHAESQTQVDYLADEQGYRPVVRFESKNNESSVSAHFALGQSFVPELELNRSQAKLPSNSEGYIQFELNYDDPEAREREQAKKKAETVNEVLANLFPHGFSDIFRFSFAEDQQQAAATPHTTPRSERPSSPVLPVATDSSESPATTTSTTPAAPAAERQNQTFFRLETSITKEYRREVRPGHTEVVIETVKTLPTAAHSGEEFRFRDGSNVITQEDLLRINRAAVETPVLPSLLLEPAAETLRSLDGPIVRLKEHSAEGEVEVEAAESDGNDDDNQIAESQHFGQRLAFAGIGYPYKDPAAYKEGPEVSGHTPAPAHHFLQHFKPSFAASGSGRASQANLVQALASVEAHGEEGEQGPGANEVAEPMATPTESSLLFVTPSSAEASTPPPWSRTPHEFVSAAAVEAAQTAQTADDSLEQKQVESGAEEASGRAERAFTTTVEVQKSLNIQNSHITEQGGQLVEQHETFYPPEQSPQLEFGTKLASAGPGQSYVSLAAHPINVPGVAGAASPEAESEPESTPEPQSMEPPAPPAPQHAGGSQQMPVPLLYSAPPYAGHNGPGLVENHLAMPFALAAEAMPVGVAVPVQVDHFIDRPYPVETIVEKPVPVPYPVERVVEKRVPVEVERIVERPVEKVVEKYVDRPVPVPIRVPVAFHIPMLHHGHGVPHPNALGRAPPQPGLGIRTVPAKVLQNYYERMVNKLLPQFGARTPMAMPMTMPKAKQGPAVAPNLAHKNGDMRFDLKPPPLPQPQSLVGGGWAQGSRYIYNTLPHDLTAAGATGHHGVAIAAPAPNEPYDEFTRWRNGHALKRSPDFGRTLHMEYGFKPPLVPSVEINEHGVPLDQLATAAEAVR